MKLGQILLLLPSLLQISTSLPTPIPQHGRQSLSTRATIGNFFDITDEQNPVSMRFADEQVIRRTLTIARTLGVAMLRVNPDNALYTRFFGDPDSDVYNTVMGNVRRVVNLLGDASPEELRRTSPQNEDNVDGQIFFVRENAIPGNRRAAASTVGNTVFLHPAFFDAPPGFSLPMTQGDLDDPAFLDRQSQSRGAILFHEASTHTTRRTLIHLVSHGRMQNEINNLESAIPGFSLPDDEDNVADINVRGILTAQEAQNPNIAAAIPARSDVAYGAAMTTLLASLTNGRFAAALNADSYSNLAIAALFNMNSGSLRPNIQGLNDPADFPTTQTSVWNVDAAENNILTRVITQQNNSQVRTSFLWYSRKFPGRIGQDFESL
ncbi:hypothetical protein BDV96DRAFT_647932 [Lophiotrema nucula]|uniref:Uncharacterized protein n=1 Tax=Lophiotrema nucula TaxID=690887 RepID=A0A6A5Z5T4_9PLEO|nr:hypothetical protein BDV96DRAFT_647932 [Lophiotrema nucula]